MQPLAQYENDLAQGNIKPDEAQAHAVQFLQAFYHDITQRQQRSCLSKLLSLVGMTKPPVQGLYMWGDVGTGKTYLMDLLYNSLPFTNKYRCHFHKFMRDTHLRLAELQGTKNPLETIAKDLAKDFLVICFDEFVVNDITDAMILGRLVDALFAQGISLVTTSNCHPDQLYEFGIQRQQFLPAIAHLKQHTQLIHVDGNIDYRARELEEEGVYYFPLDDNAARRMQHSFSCFAGTEGQAEHEIIVNNRPIQCIRSSGRVIWFDFNVLCNPPRSQRDYLQLAHEYDVLLLSDIPKIKSRNLNQVRYLMSLVDIYYDNSKILVMSAACDPEQLYAKGKLSKEFKRTISRMYEMQSLSYLNKLPISQK